MKLSDIKVNPRNPQTFDDLSILEASVQDFPKMFKYRPIVVDNDGMVLGGNKRLICLQRLGFKEIPNDWVKVASDLTEDEKRRFIISDNVGHGEWAWDVLKEDWDENDLKDWGVEVPVWEDEKKEIEEDDYDESEKIETNIAYGDLFKVGNHFLLCGDATKKEDCDKLSQGNKSDLVFTDPPYDLDDNYSQNIFDNSKEDSHIFIMNSDKLLIQNVVNGIDIFRKFFAVDFRQARLVSNNQPMTRVDLIAEFCKGKTKFNNLFDGFSTLIECAKIHNDNEEINFGHKQAKKIELPATFISHYSKEFENIFDYFGGSGSTMAACEQLDRNCFMMEKEPENCQRIIGRMEKCYRIKAEKIN